MPALVAHEATMYGGGIGIKRARLSGLDPTSQALKGTREEASNIPKKPRTGAGGEASGSGSGHAKTTAGKKRKSDELCKDYNSPQGCRYKSRCGFTHKCKKCHQPLADSLLDKFPKCLAGCYGEATSEPMQG